MGLNLAGVGTLLRRGIDDVGSAITGQPAQSNPTPPPQARQTTPVIGQASSLPDIHVGVAAPQNIQVGNQTIMPTPDAITGMADRNFNPNPFARAAQMEFHNPVANTIGGAVKPLASTAFNLYKATPFNPQNDVNAIRSGIGLATGNMPAFHNAIHPIGTNIHGGVSSARQFAQGTAAQAYQLGESLNPAGGDVFNRVHTPTGGAEKFVLGTNPIPSMQNQFRNTQKTQGTGQALSDISLTALMDAAGGKGAVDGAIKIAPKAAGVVKPLIAGVTPMGEDGFLRLPKFSSVADNAASEASGLQPHQVINANEANTLRDHADAIGGDHFAGANETAAQAHAIAKNVGLDITTGSPVERIDRIYSYLNQLKTHNDTHNMVSQGGYARIPTGKLDPAADLHPEQKSFINDYAEMLQGMDAGNGVSINHETGMRSTSNSPFYRQVFAETGRAPTKADWFNEARRQIESGKGMYDASQDYKNLPSLQDTPLAIPAGFESYGEPIKIQPRSQKASIAITQPETNLAGLTPDQVLKLKNNVYKGPDLNGTAFTKEDTAKLGADVSKQTRTKGKPPVEKLPPNKSVPNPIVKELPDVKPGDYGQARTNPKIVENGINNEGKLWAADFGKLSKAEKADFFHYVEHPNVERSARLQKAIDSWQRTTDTVHAFDTALGGKTRHIDNYALHGQFDLTDPHTNELYGQEMMRRGITDTEPNAFNGYRNQPRTFATRAEQEAWAAKTGAQLLPSDPLKEGIDYINSASNTLKKEALIQAAQKSDAEAGQATHNLDIGVHRGAPTTISLSKKGAAELKGYAKPADVSKPHQGYRILNRTAKANILGASGYHTTNINVLQAFPATLLKHPGLAVKGLFEGSAGLFSDSFSNNLFRKYVDSGLTEKAAKINSPLRDGSDFSTNGNIKLVGKGNFFERRVFDNSIALMHARVVEGTIKDLEKHNVPLESARARNAGAAVNHTMGLVSQELQNLRPGLQRAISDVAFAPQFTRSKFAVYKDLFKGNEATGQAARTIAGKYIMEATLALTIGAVLQQKQDSVKDTLLRTLVHPAIETNINDGKGGKVELGLPHNIISEAANLVTTLKRNNKGQLQIKAATPSKIGQNVTNYGINRLAVIPGTVLKDVKNQQFNGQNVRDTSATIPQQIIQTATNNINSLLPIPLQGAGATTPVNNLIKIASPTAAMALKKGATAGNPLVNSAASSFALTPRSSRTTGAPLQSSQFADQRNQYMNLLKAGKLSQIDPSLKDVSPQEAHQLVNDYNAKHPTGNTDPNTGMPYPKQYDANSGAEKHAAYVNNDPKTGAETLNASYYIDKKLAMMTPDRPHDPIFDLNGKGVGFTLDKDKNVVGTSDADKAKIALDYGSLPASDDQRALILAANPWLSDYEKQVGDYGKNYQQNINAYQQAQGYSPAAIADYNTKHPNTQAPVAPPTFSPATQKLMDDYSAITDPTEKAQFFQDNAAELSRAYAADAVYKNQKAVAQGALPLQDHPNPTPDQAAALAQLQKNPNHDKAIGKANALLIQAHPELAQYLADSGLYNVAKDVAKYQFRDPGHPDLNQQQLINLGRPNDQAALKGIQNLGKYDIGKDANGNYSFLGAGGTGKFADGTASGSGGSGGHYYKYAKKVKAPKFRRIKLHNPHEHRVRTSKSYKLKTPSSQVPKESAGSIKIKKVMVK